MKYIKIFLASSIVELKEERLQLSDFIRSLNDNYVHRGIYFELITCENLSSALVKGRKQQEYNAAITESEYFYVLFGKNLGQYTEEEFNTALAHFHQTGAPKIYTYFRQLPDGMEPSKTIVDFMQRLAQELGHYYNTFAHIDAIKLNLLLELTRDKQIGGTVELEDGCALVNGNAILQVNEIPVYRKNDTLQAIVQQRAKLDAEYAELVALSSLQSNSPLLRGLLEENTRKRFQLQEQQYRLEKEVLNFYAGITEKRQLGSGINWREKLAIEMIDRGDYEGAKNILRDETWSKEIAQAEAMVEHQQQEIQAYISGKRTLIQAIFATGITAETEKEIISCYEEIVALSKKHHVQMLVLLEYADFLMNHNQHDKAGELCRQLDHFYAFSGISDEHSAKVKYLLACILYKTNALAEAEQYHRDALSIRKRSRREGDPTSMAQYAISCNQLGYLLFRMNRYEESVELYQEGIETFQVIVEDTPKYSSNLALILNNMGILKQATQEYKEAAHYFCQSMALRRKIAANGSTSALGFLAMSCLNYAKLLTELKDPQADAYYCEAIDLYQQLCTRDTKFRIDLTIGQYYRASALEKTDPNLAIQIHTQVLQQRLALAETNLRAIEADLARSYLALGRLLTEKDRPLANTYLENAGALWRELYQKAPEKYGEESRKFRLFMDTLSQ